MVHLIEEIPEYERSKLKKDFFNMTFQKNESGHYTHGNGLQA